MLMNKLVLFFVVFGLVLVSLFIFWKKEDSPQILSCQKLNALSKLADTQQVLLVKSLGGIKATIAACSWNKKKGWHADVFKQPVAAVIGKKGLAALGKKKEGDLKTPSGLYPIQWTFGVQPLALKMNFRLITSDDKFIDDPSDPLYNTWVEGATKAHSYERMMHPLYKVGAVVNYNMNPTLPGAGSAIFLHIWRSEKEGTAGCIALSEQYLLHILHWLDKKQKPYIYIVV